MIEAPAVEAKFVAAAEGLFSGYASLFGGAPDAQGDVVAPGAFARTLNEHKAAGTAPLLLWQHDLSSPIGVWLDLHEDSAGLAVKGQLVLAASRGREAHALLKAGALDGLSIGYRVRAFDRRPGGGRLLKDLDLIEISLVSLPAGARARVLDVKSAADAAQPEEKVMDLQENASADTGAPEIEARLAALEAGAGAIDTRLAQVENQTASTKAAAERIETRLNRPGVALETKAAPEKIETKAFEIFVRRGREALGPDEVKALVVASDTAGGYLAPEPFTAELLRNLVLFSPIRQAARVSATAQSSVVLPRRVDTLTASWVGETELRPGTEPTYGQLELGIHELACHVDVSNVLLEDAAFDMANELARDFAEEFGRAEGAAFVTGDGVKKPVGLLNSGIATVKTGNATGLPTTNPADPLIDLYHSLPGAYAQSAVWGMNRTTLGLLRKVKDGSGAYLLADPLAAGQPSTILGRPIVELPDMPDVAAGALSVVFGDFASGFRVFDRTQLSILRDPYTVQVQGLVRFHARRRVGGGVVRPDAFRLLKIAA